MDLLDLAEIRSKMMAIDAGRTEVKLIAGDVGLTCRKYVEDNPGFKVSFLNMDLDLAEPTLAVSDWEKSVVVVVVVVVLVVVVVVVYIGGCSLYKECPQSRREAS